MINVLALFPNTMDHKVMDDLLSRIIPALKQANGLLALRINEGHVMSYGGPSPYLKVVEASFESLGKFMSWVQTPAARADTELLNNSGVVRLYYEVNEL